MSNNLRIAAIPLDIIPADPQANLRATAAALAALPPGTDIAVLPELFSTGFTAGHGQPGTLAETNSGPTIQALAGLSRRHNLAIAGSFMARTAQSIYNRGFFIEPSGDETFYDKHHLFCMSAENRTFTRGLSHMPVVRFRGWNIAMIICYDLRFPAWCRNQKQRYDVLLVPANWASAREYAWRQLLIARAIENQAVVVGANRSGRDDYGDYDNLSYIFDAMGRSVGQVAGSSTVIADVSLEDLEKCRRRMPVATDADDFDLRISPSGPTPTP